MQAKELLQRLEKEQTLRDKLVVCLEKKEKKKEDIYELEKLIEESNQMKVRRFLSFCL